MFNQKGSAGDPLTCALFIIKGNTSNLDLVKITQGQETMFSFLNLSFGFSADVDIESDKYRWLGELRFSVSIVARLINFRRYKARFLYLPVTQPQQSIDRATYDLNAPFNVDPQNPPNGWETIEDEFIVFVAANLSHFTITQPIAPEAKPNNGEIHVVLGRYPKIKSRKDVISHLEEFGTHFVLG